MHSKCAIGRRSPGLPSSSHYTNKFHSPALPCQPAHLPLIPWGGTTFTVIRITFERMGLQHLLLCVGSFVAFVVLRVSGEWEDVILPPLDGKTGILYHTYAKQQDLFISKIIPNHQHVLLQTLFENI